MNHLIKSNELINCVQNDDQIDPRIQTELESLNSLSQLINQLELELNEKRFQVKKILNEFGSKIDKLSKKLGSCVYKARPYYEAKINGNKLQLETQKATLKFERACSSHLAAKEMVSLAEQVFIKKGRIYDPLWQEMIDQTTSRVNQIELERIQSEKEHLITSKRYNEEEQLIQRLQKKLKRSIAKARPYFELKSKLDQTLEEHIQKVKFLEDKVRHAKINYSNVLHRLESISDEIHERRKSNSNILFLRNNGSDSSLISIQSLIEEEKNHSKLNNLIIEEISQSSDVDDKNFNNNCDDSTNDDDDFNDCESFMSLENFSQNQEEQDDLMIASINRSNETLNADEMTQETK